jgi:hypothetical protein
LKKPKRQARALVTERRWATTLREMAAELDPTSELRALSKAQAEIADLEYMLEETRTRAENAESTIGLRDARIRLLEKENAAFAAQREWQNKRDKFFRVLLEARSAGLLSEDFIDCLERIDWRLRDYRRNTTVQPCVTVADVVTAALGRDWCQEAQTQKP